MCNCKLLCVPAVTLSSRWCMLSISRCMLFFSSMSIIVFEHCYIVCGVFRSPWFVSFLIILIRSTNIYIHVFPWSFAKSADLFDRDSLITYHSPSTSFCRYLLNTGGLYDSGFGLNECLQTVPTSAYAIDILTRCCYTAYPCDFIE